MRVWVVVPRGARRPHHRLLFNQNQALLRIERGEGPALPIVGDKRRRFPLTVPADAEPGATMHIVAKVTDDRTQELTLYQRVILNIRG